MNKLFLYALITLTYLANPLQGEEKTILQNQPTSHPKTVKQEFSASVKQKLSKTLGINDLRVGEMTDDNGNKAIVIQLDNDITLREARAILITTVQALQSIVEGHPDYSNEIPGLSANPHNMSLVIDTYDETKEKEQQFGVSSILLTRGMVYFMGISQVSGKEVLMHKQSYENALKTHYQQTHRQYR